VVVMNSSSGSRNSTPRTNQIFFWALTNDYASLKAALESGVSVNVIDPVTTDSPLMIACRKGHIDIVRVCLEYGAKNDPHPEFGQTALHASVSEQKLESARVLLQVAAESDADHIISNLSDPSGQTPLHAAAYLGSTSLVELLLHHGAELSSVDVQGQTALHLCASSGVKVCLAMLLDHGGDNIIDLQDNSGNTALHHATYHGRMECVRLLLETAADVSIRNYEGFTAYNIASSQGHHQIGLLLFEYRDLHNGRALSAPSSALPTPSKPVRSSSHGGTPLTYQTPQSSARYGSYGSYDQQYAFSPSMRMQDVAEDQPDSPERQVRLSIRPQSSNSGPNSSNGGALSLKVPLNPMSSMYGAVGGMESLDSIGSFLPRPHTVNSPNMHKPGGMHAAALRGQHHSARASPSLGASNNYSSTNPMRRSADASGSASNLTQLGVAAHNRRHDSTKGGALTSPMSPTSEPSSLENGPTGSGYKVLTKQSQSQGFGPPSLR
jgi:ankyrin repeat protein